MSFEEWGDLQSGSYFLQPGQIDILKNRTTKKKQALMARSNKPLVFFIWQIWAVFVCVQFISMM